RAAGYSRSSGRLLWRDDTGRAASMARQGTPVWIGEVDDDKCFIKFRGWLLCLNPGTGATPWMRETSGTAPCVLRKDEVIDLRCGAKYNQDSRTKSTRLVLRSLDTASGRLRSSINLRHFEGMYDELFVGTALEGNVLYLELRFVTRD